MGKKIKDAARVVFGALSAPAQKVTTIAQRLGKLEATFSDAFLAWAEFHGEDVDAFEAEYSKVLAYLREKDRTTAYNRVKHYRGRLRAVADVVGDNATPADAVAFVNENGGKLQGSKVAKAISKANAGKRGPKAPTKSEGADKAPAATPAADLASKVMALVADVPADVVRDALAIVTARLEKRGGDDS